MTVSTFKPFGATGQPVLRLSANQFEIPSVSPQQVSLNRCTVLLISKAVILQSMNVQCNCYGYYRGPGPAPVTVTGDMSLPEQDDPVSVRRYTDNDTVRSTGGVSINIF